MVTHDGPKPANHRRNRDPRPSVAAAALPAPVRQLVGRVGGDVPHVGFGPARGATRVVGQARELAAANDPCRLWSLQELATELGVHVRTLRDAARTGRLEVTYENRVVFRNPVPRSTIAAGRAFIERYYRKSYSRFVPKPRPPIHVSVPSDWARKLLYIRRELQLTQAQLAEKIGVAGKAVVYQWESSKRTPSPVFWERIIRLAELPSGSARSRDGHTLADRRLACRIAPPPPGSERTLVVLPSGLPERR